MQSPKTPMRNPNVHPGLIRLAALVRQHHDRIAEVFREWDINHDGKISQIEFVQALEKIGFGPDKQAINAVFKQIESSP